MNYDTLANQETVNKTKSALGENGIKVHIAENGKDALETIKTLIPKGASVMNGSSRTLEQIGFVDYLKQGNHGWNNLHQAILEEKDRDKQKLLRRRAALADYYLGSVHALTQTGEFIIASNSGSQLPHIVYTSPNLVFVVGAQKIVPTIQDGFARLKEYVVPLEDVHMKELYGTGTMVSKVLIFKKENPMMGRNVHLIIVNEKLGF